MKRLLSGRLAYDGKALGGDGWSHFNSMKAVWLAWKATGRKDYREAYDRAMAVYTIDKKGIYKYGEPLTDPGQPETFGGKQAFLRRLTVYGVFKADKLYVRLESAGRPKAAPLQIEGLTLRSWSH